MKHSWSCLKLLKISLLKHESLSVTAKSFDIPEKKFQVDDLSKMIKLFSQEIDFSDLNLVELPVALLHNSFCGKRNKIVLILCLQS